uniref:Potassium channel domain-containing protein n=1 Tax=Plectus sambesii TaxID=2011161 RepID=A0A914XHN8_9BILA
MDWFGAASAIFEKVKWTYSQFKLKYLVPFIIILLYTLFGALIFRMCELETDMAIRDRYRRAIDYAYDQVQRRMLEIRCHDTFLVNDSDSQEMHTRDAIDWFLVKLNLTQTIEERSDSSPWSWPGSMFYAGTLYTTIGYGRPSTQTTAGQFATILYIMFGIPLFLTTLKEVGKHLSRLLRKVYKKWIKARQHIPATPAPIRRYSQAMQKHLHLSLPSSRQSSIKRKKKQESAERTLDDVELGLSDHEMEEDEDELSLKDVVVVDGQKNVVSFSEEEEKGPRHLPTLKDQFDAKVDVHRGTPFPISLALFILILWICMSAGLFCIWEKEWGYFMSVYFFFVSIRSVMLRQHAALLVA